MSRKKQWSKNMKYEVKVEMTINPSEAFMIDSGFKNNDGELFQDYRPILLVIANCIVNNEQITIVLSESELWDLRSRVNMGMSVGDVSGADLLLKIYGLIIECQKKKLIAEACSENKIILLSQEEYDEIENENIELAWLDTEVKHAREREDEDYTKDYSEARYSPT